MPLPDIVLIAEAVKNHLNAGAFSQAFTASGGMTPSGR